MIVNNMFVNIEETKKTIRMVNKSPHDMPKYANVGDSGFDLRAWINESYKEVKKNDEGNLYIELKPLERVLIHTGIYVNLPKYTELQVRSRSGMSLKKGVIVCNTPGTVDCYYTGEVGVILINLSNEIVEITDGDRIAQAVLMPVFNSELTEIVKVDELVENNGRSSGGFGHTGFK